MHISTSPLLQIDPYAYALCISLDQISLEEFMAGAHKDPWLMDQLKLDISPSGWFLNSKT